MNEDEKVVIKRTVLTGSPDTRVAQRIASVFIRGKEYRVLAPGEATGDPLEWVEHWTVRQSESGFISGYSESTDEVRMRMIMLVEQALEKEKTAQGGKTGKHPDGLHCAAQICESGHLRHVDGWVFETGEFCPECGAACIEDCPKCK